MSPLTCLAASATRRARIIILGFLISPYQGPDIQLLFKTQKQKAGAEAPPSRLIFCILPERFSERAFLLNGRFAA
jgi:hypothetical protein